MALEDQIEKLVAATEKQNTLLERLLPSTEKQNTLLERLLASSGNAAAAKDKPATTSKKAAETKESTAAEEKPAAAEAEGPTYPELKKAFGAWLAEHPKGSAEQTARREYLQGNLFKKLGISKLDELDGKPAELGKLQKWLDTKATTDLLGFGAGVFAEPVADDAGGDDDGEDL